MSIANTNRNFRTSDLFVEKGDFLRLKNVSLGIRFPKLLLMLCGCRRRACT